jgi:LysR family transcriptional regulator, transcription activator of glutamate synthase operon
MDIDRIKEFVVLSEVGNYLEASDRLYISQSSLSKHIQSLEEELGTQLFDRTTRKIKLSAAGEAFLPYAQKIAAATDEGMIAVNKAIEASSKFFSLGVIPSLDSYGISDILSDFGKNTKGYKIKVVEEDTGALMEFLKDETVSMAFAYQIGEGDPSLNYIPVLEDHLVCVCSRGNDSLPEKELPIVALREKNLMLLEGHTVLGKLTTEACKDAGFAPNITKTHRRFLSSYDLNDESNVAIFFNQDATYVNNPGNRVIEIVPQVTCWMCLCYPKKHDLTEEEKYLIDITKKHSIPKRNN